jgi:hypothetical protein
MGPQAGEAALSEVHFRSPEACNPRLSKRACRYVEAGAVASLKIRPLAWKGANESNALLGLAQMTGAGLAHALQKLQRHLGGARENVPASPQGRSLQNHRSAAVFDRTVDEGAIHKPFIVHSERFAMKRKSFKNLH